MFNMIEVLIGLALTLFLLPLIWLAYESMVKPKKFPPGPIGVPFIGSFHQIQPMHTKIADVAKVYGDIFSIKLGKYNVICLTGYELIKEVLVDRAKEFANRRSFRFAKIIRGEEIEGIVVAKGPKWSAHRKFFHTALRNMGLNKQGLETSIRDEIPAITKELEMSCHKEDYVDPTTVLEYASLNVLAAFVFGNRYAYGDAGFQKLLEANNMFFKKAQLFRTPSMFMYNQLPLLHHFWMPSSCKQIANALGLIQNFAKSEIQHHKETIDRESPRDFIDYYLLETMKDDNKWFFENRLEYTICDLFQAGTETTSTTLRWALLYVANHQEVQKKIHKEIDDVIGLQREPKYEDRLSMPYCEAAILEIHRKASIAPVALLHTATYDTNIRGYKVPKNTLIVPALYSMHHSTKYWKNPDNFDPENFLDADGKVEINDAFMPFGTGLRICVGMNLAKLELFLFFVGILQKFQVNLPDGVESLSEEPVIGGTLTPIPYKLKFIQRS